METDLITDSRAQKWFKLTREMLCDRGFSNHHRVKEFIANGRISIRLRAFSTRGRCFLVFFDCPPNYVNPSTISKDAFNAYYREAERLTGIKRVIIVSQTPLKSQPHHLERSIEKFVHIAGNSKLKGIIPFEVWLYDQLTINPIKHRLVPAQQKLSSKEKHRLRKQWKIKAESLQHLLPKLSVNDPIVRWFNWKPGSLIRIEPKYSGTTVLFYRYVVAT